MLIRREKAGSARPDRAAAPLRSAWLPPGVSLRRERGFITGRRQSELEKAVATIEGNVTVIQGDASHLADIDRIYQTVKTQAGRIDVLFVNAGFYEFGKFGEITQEHFDKTFNTNVRGLLFAVQKALPLLSHGSSVIPRLGRQRLRQRR